MGPQLNGFFHKVDELSESFIERLRKAVAIPSVSAEDERRPDVVRVCSLTVPIHQVKADSFQRCPNFSSMS